MNEQPKDAKRGDKNLPSAISAPFEAGIEDRDLRIEVFAVCDGAYEEGTRLSLLGAYEMLGSASFPFVVPQMTMVLRVRFGPLEPLQQHLRLSLIDPDGRSVRDFFDGQADLQPADGNRGAAYNFICAMKGIGIARPGEYSFDFYLNDRLEGRLPLCVFRTTR